MASTVRVHAQRACATRLMIGSYSVFLAKSMYSFECRDCRIRRTSALHVAPCRSTVSGDYPMVSLRQGSVFHRNIRIVKFKSFSIIMIHHVVQNGTHPKQGQGRVSCSNPTHTVR